MSHLFRHTPHTTHHTLHTHEHSTTPNTPPHTSFDRSSTAAMSTKRARATKPTSADFYREGKEVQNRSGRVTTAANEDRLFREFFGCGADKALIAWNMLESSDLVPPGGKINHLLWTLFFMKQYPVEGLACGAVGGSKGKIDPKTYRKWVWPFLCALSELEPYVVSFVLKCSPSLFIY